MGKIIVVGSINMDIVIKVPYIPAVGETILADEVSFFHGGKGANQATAAARLGGNVHMIGRVGNDEYGKSSVDSLRNNNVKTDRIQFDDTFPTGTAYINVSRNGENNIIVNQEANGNLSVQDIMNNSDLFEAGDICLIQLEIPIDVAIYVIELCRNRGIKLILNPAPANPVINEYLNDVYAVIPNEIELAALVNSHISCDNDLLANSKKLLEKGAVNVITTIGERGSIFVNKDTSFLTKAVPVQKKDTTAAGDTFIGAFCVAIYEGKTIKEAINFATHASALTITKEGAQESLPTRAEVEDFIAKMKIIK
ncbi:MAG: ribokinase [Clostridiaceae bacterium]|nr:ribokinase [Clostridiaceae bacterium]